MTPPPDEKDAQEGAPPPDDKAKAEDKRTNVGIEGADPGRPGAADPEPAAEPPVQEQLTAEEKLADPAAAGALPSDAAASIEKPAEAAAPAPEGAQPQDAATKADAPKPTPKPAAERPARPAKEAEPKEAPRVEPPPGSINEVFAAALPAVQMTASTVPATIGDSVAIEVGRDDLDEVMTLARDDARLDLKYLRCLSGVDWQEEGLEVVYHLSSMSKPHTLTVKTRVTTEDAVVPSIAALYPAADWHERETRDMFGIHFEGHWNLVPLLLPEDMTDHFPLRKDNPLQEIEEWQGDNLREGAGEGDE
ncbi:MAG: NADH-quinone oxidoreductase subunit C [Dehalococcoidia bacterium]